MHEQKETLYDEASFSNIQMAFLKIDPRYSED